MLMQASKLALALIGVLLLAGQQSAWGASDPCHLREFDLCMASAIVFVQQPVGTKVNEAEIERQCALFKETEECIDEFTDRCTSPMQNTLIEFMSGGMLENMKHYCQKGHPNRASYLKHGDCVNKQRKNTNKCMIDFQAAIEKSTETETNWKERPAVLCCAMDRMRKCTEGIVEPACGKDAVKVANMMIEGTFSKASQVMCRKYSHTSAQCKSLLPPSGTVPKGAKSNSVLSKLMSTATQA